MTAPLKIPDWTTPENRALLKKQCVPETCPHCRGLGFSPHKTGLRGSWETVCQTCFGSLIRKPMIRGDVVLQLLEYIETLQEQHKKQMVELVESGGKPYPC